jgi:DNA-binding XRE family transcriptional regulator
MNVAKRKRLESAGWKVGSAGEFLGLSTEETLLVELKLALSDALRRRRQKRHLTQFALAKKLASSQSRVAKLESGGPGVSLDLLVRALLATGATPADIARELSPRRRSAA